MTRRPLLLGALALLALPATSLAHDATVACDATSPSGYAIVADYQHLNPQPTFTDTSVIVRWSDGYRVVLPLPAGCVPVPPVVPPAPPNSPQPVIPPPADSPQPVMAAPPVVSPGGPEPMPRVHPRPPLRATKTVRTLRSIACTRAGQRSSSIVRIRVVWKRGGVIVKTKQRMFRKPGVVCHLRGLTG